MQKNKSTLIDDYAKADPTQLMNQFHTGNEGLSQAEAQKRLEKYGENTIRQAKRQSELLVFLENFYLTNGYLTLGVRCDCNICRDA